MRSHLKHLKTLSRADLGDFVTENLRSLAEDEVLAVLANPYCSSQLIGSIAQQPRLTGFYAVRLALVAHRNTPQAHAVKLIHYLYFFDLLRLSVNVMVPAPVRRAIDTQLLNRAEKLSLGERVSSARACAHGLIRHFLFDPHPRVFEALLMNKRLREDDLLALVSSHRASPEQLTMLANDMKWGCRYSIRKAIVTNPNTPRAIAASQLRYLSRADLRKLHSNPETSVYLRRCIERLTPRLITAKEALE